ncbi:methyltransferase domain-containing protein [bacterium]|nr:methyltransferase domain-containing protein [bacterium]
MHEKYIIQDQRTLAAIEKAMLESYFKDDTREYLASSQGKVDIDANVFDRYNRALESTIPWVSKAIDLKGKTLIEIGCGTGSSTAAFSHFVEKITGYDIDKKSIDGAKVRLDILEISNAEAHLVTAENVIQKVQADHPAGADIILLYAVLEHQTIQERHETLKKSWDLLNNDGLLIVTDTPNLLCYHDYHTSLLPFVHMLPAELYAKYIPSSDREGFKDDFSGHETNSMDELELKISRWGRGVSYHDFELALGEDYDKYIICNGFEQEILSYLDVSQEEELLRLYIQQRKELHIPLALTRVFLNFILRKRSDNNVTLPAPPENKLYTTMDELKECQASACHLKKTLSEMQNSRRWKIGCLVAAPYRACKQLFMRDKTT